MRSTDSNPIHEYTHLRAEGYSPNEALQLVALDVAARTGAVVPTFDIPNERGVLTPQQAAELVGTAQVKETPD